MSQSPTADRDLVALPRTAVLLLWSAAYLRGDLGPDDAAELAYGADRSRPAPGGEDLFDWMTSLRRLPLAAPRLVLPQPGRIAGLVGPPRPSPPRCRPSRPSWSPPPASPTTPWCPP